MMDQAIDRAASLFTLFAIVVLPVQANQIPVLWGSLKPGPYAVGHRSFFSTDHARRDIVDLQHKPSERLNFRPVLCAMWYPAAKTSSQALTYSEYLDLPTPPEFPDLALKFRKFGYTAASQSMLKKSYDSLNSTFRTGVDHVLANDAYASRVASPAAGRFPLVIYHPGAAGSFDENSVLFEFLASHGYVVISSAYQWGTGHVGNDIGGPERSFDDMQFLLQLASTLEFVDVHQIAAIGHSAGAQLLLRWIGQLDCPVQAAVSVDTTLEYTPQNFPGHKQLRQALLELDNPVIPVLLFASAERDPNFSTFDPFLKRTTRYEASVRGLRHDDFTTHGMMRAYAGEIEIPTATRSAIRSGYARVCETILQFLKAWLRGDERARSALKQAAGPDQVLKLHYKKPQ